VEIYGNATACNAASEWRTLFFTFLHIDRGARGDAFRKSGNQGRSVAEKTTIIAGAKGGVGTSTVALNLAVQLAVRSGKRVALVDLARPFGQISLMLDFEPRFTVLDALERMVRLDEKVLASLATRHKSGIEILAGPRHAAMKPEQRQSVTLEALSGLIEIADRTYDRAVVDIGVVNPADWAPVLQRARMLLLVSEPSALSLGMIERHTSAAARAGVDCERIHVVVNRWRQSDEEAIAAFEKNHKRAVLARLPNDYRQLTEAVQLGIPLMSSASNALVCRYRDLAEWLAGRLEAVSASATDQAIHA
jgi:pilus assembly protein CpaE